MIINNDEIKFYDKTCITEVPWEKHDVDIIIDSSGIYDNVVSSHNLIKNKTIKKIIVTFSPKDSVDKTIIFGVNEDTFNPQKHHVISTSICDANAAGPALKLLDDEVGVDHGFITTLHPWLSYQNLLDGSLRSVESPGHFWKDYALGRSSILTVIPKPTTLVRALHEVMPIISKNMEALSFRVPTNIVSTSDLTINLKNSVSVKDINELFKSKAAEKTALLGYNDEQLVSTDFKGISESIIIDGRWTRIMNGKTIKCILWYDNEWGYSNRVVDMVRLIEKSLT
jgi:glyceraldehyde 3-phosphate dehydrogenase